MHVRTLKPRIMRAGFFLYCLLLLPALSAATEKKIFGLNEYVALPELNVQLPAKLDTGAQTASLSAHNIERFKRDGENWVRFYLEDGHAQPIERPLARVSKIKRRAGDFDPDEERTYTARPVIELELCLGGTRRNIEVNLTDRSAFQYPLLIGSRALTRFGALVDPSLTYAAGSPDCLTVSDAHE